MRATHQVGYIVQNLTVKNSAIGMQYETILLKAKLLENIQRYTPITDDQTAPFQTRKI